LYFIFLGINGEIVSLPKYIPKKEDRGGINISCKDMAHIHWKRKDTFMSTRLLPYCNNYSLTPSNFVSVNQ